MSKKETVWSPSEKGLAVIELMQNASEGSLFGDQIAEPLGFNTRGIHGVMNPLVKNGLVAKGEKVERTITKDEKEVKVMHTPYSLTDAGVAFTAPVAE